MFFLCVLFLFGVFTEGKTKPPIIRTTEQYHQTFNNMTSKSELENNLRFFSSIPHMETSIGNENITNHIRDTWKSYGFEVEEPEYEVLMSLPQEDNPNKVSIINDDTKEVDYEIVGQLNVTAGGLQGNDVFKYKPFLAYSPNGTVEGELVYANLGSEKDFQELEKRNISVKGKIVMFKDLFGEVRNAKLRGAVGAIVYPDPITHALEGIQPGNTYPQKPWMPPNGVQSKSLSNILGEKVPTSMAGNLPVGYRFGPGFKPNSSNKTLIVKLEVNNQYVTKKIRNVIATISGSEEPDRYVLIGNHKDAVTFGGSDPSSGMAVLMEISRVLWKLKQNGWRPRRTIKLCSWAGKEFEMLGSSEWVEENEDILRDRVVAYLNTDVAIGGNFVLAPQSSTMLGDLILNHAKKFQDPTNSNLTIYDNMFQRMPKYTDYPGEPYVYEFRHFSDTLPFSIFLSLPAADFSYFFGFQIAARLFSLSHSQYDTFYSVKTFADPNFLYCKTMTQFLGSMLLNVSDSVILPFSVRKLAKCVDRAYLSISSPNQLDSLQMNELRQSKDAFSAMVTNFESAKQNIAGQTQNPLKLRALNDQLSGIEKKFSSPYSKTNWPTDKSLLFNCKFWNIKKVMELKNIPESEKRERLKFEMSLMIQKLRAATKFLKPIN